MQPTSTTTAETMQQLQQAALQIATGFENAQHLTAEAQCEAMREASAALIEMRRTTDYLAQLLR